MRRHIHYSASVLAFIFLTGCAAQGPFHKPVREQNAIAALQRQIDLALQDSVLQQTRTGIKIVSLKTGETLYQKNSRELFHPASNMKLLTTATALNRLGPDFRFRTLLLADTGSINDSTISGNIYLKGFADPSLNTEDLHRIVKKLRFRGIRRITGNLMCDESYLDDLYLGLGWMWDDASSEDFAPISALSVNDNCVEVTVKPAARPGDSLLVRLEPQTDYMKIENHGVTVDSNDSVLTKAFKVERKWKHPENTIVIEGGLIAGGPERTFKREVIDPARYAGTLFSDLLEQQQISLQGTVLKGVAPDTTILLAEHLSPPLSQIVFHTNKVSHNLSAELLLKTLGAEKKGVPGSAKKGISLIYQFLQEIGIDSTSYKLADGSGVSRYDLVTPELIVALLRAMYHDFRVQAEYQSSLPIAGLDGTLEKRMISTPAEGTLRAKTGTLSGVSALSGYTVTADSEIVAFSVMMEHFVGSASKIRKVQDRIGELLSSFSRETAALRREPRKK